MNKYPLEQTANHLASQGRYGDSMLVHMNPKEVAGIASLLPEGQLTRNPQTGIFEAFSLGDILPMVLPFIPGFGQLGALAKMATAAGVSAATGGNTEENILRGLTAGASDLVLGGAADAIPDAASGISPTDALASATDTLGQTQALNLQNLAALDPADKIAAMNLQGLSGDALTNLSNIDPALLQDPSFMADLAKMNPETFAGMDPAFAADLTKYSPADFANLQNVGQSTLGNPQALAGIQNISPEGLESVIGSQSAVDMAQANVASAKDALYKPLSFKPSGAIADMSAGDKLSMVMENPGTVAKQFLKPSVFLPPAGALAHKEQVAIKDASNRAFREAEEEREAEYDEAKARMQGMYGYADPSYKSRYLAASGGKVSLNKGGIADLVGPKKHYFYGGLGSLDWDLLGSLTPEQLALLKEASDKDGDGDPDAEDPAEAQGYDVDPLTGVALPYYEEREEGYNPYFYSNAMGWGPGSTYGASMIGRDRMPPDAYIQQNLRGRFAARPDRGYMPGFEPEFSYFQKVPFYVEDEQGNMFQNPDVFTPSRQYSPQRFNPIYGQPFFGSPVNTPSYLQNILGYSSGISQVTPMNRFLPYAGYEPPPPPVDPPVQPRVRPTDDEDTPDDPIVEDDTPDTPPPVVDTTPQGGIGDIVVGNYQGGAKPQSKPKSYEDMVTFNPETGRFEAEYFDQDAGPYYFSEAPEKVEYDPSQMTLGPSQTQDIVSESVRNERARQSVVNQLRAFSEEQAMKKYSADSPYWDNYASQFGYANPHTGEMGAASVGRQIPAHIAAAAAKQSQQTGVPVSGRMSVTDSSGETTYFQEGGVGEIAPENIKRGYDVAMTQPPAPQDGITAVLPDNQGEAEMLIEMTKKAILAEVPEEQVDAITEMYIAVFGEESYRRLRNEVLQLQNPLDEGIAAVQTEGLITGEGDGMSDSIDAHISGKQKAGLSNGEFLVPVDVLAHLGNGNSSVGAQKMYAMMDKTRQERQGNTKQAPAIDANQLIRDTLGPQYA